MEMFTKLIIIYYVSYIMLINLGEKNGVRICTILHGPNYGIMQLCKYMEINTPNCLQIMTCRKWNYG